MNNPLLEFADTPAALPRFSAIRPEHAAPALDHMLARNTAELERVLAESAAPTWETFAQPIEDMRERLVRLWSPVTHLNAVRNSESLRAAYNAGLPRLTEYFTALAQDERVYRGYKAIAASPQFAELEPAQKKIVEITLRDFRLAGAELPPDKKARFKAVQTELAQLSSRFADNVLDAKQGWALWVNEERDLAGLPEGAREMGREAAEREGKAGWKFGLDWPDFHAIVTYADKRELRQQMYEAYVTRASELGPNAGRWDNGGLIVEILKFRDEAGRLLGFPNYAEYALQTRMAKTVPEVMEFMFALAARGKPAAERDYRELADFARAQAGFEAEAWDLAYYTEKLKEARYRLADEELRPYFPEQRVVAGMFSVVERLYGIRIVAMNGVDVWHPDVRVFEIREASGEPRGRFYLDLYARADKRGGAWMDDCASRKRLAAGVQVPVAYLTCNFTPPSGGRPGLLLHDEVLTLFHEFGHGLHHLLTRVDHVGVAGMNGVAWDAVELPSQFMENWCWEREALALIAGHWQSGAPLPDELYERMIAARNFQSGMQLVRQLEFALFDMRLHSEFDVHGAASVQALLDEVRVEVAVARPPAYNRFQNSFTHIFSGGYAAGYYSYKWAEVLSADAFSKFEERGIFDRRTGREFLENILEAGGVREPMELFVEFRGRKPSIDALLRHSGLAA